MLSTIGIVAAGKGILPYGALLSKYCGSVAFQVDANNQSWFSLYIEAWRVYSDGVGGTYQQLFGTNTDGCFYPYGYYYEYSVINSYLQWYSPYESGQFVYGYSTSWQMADGAGGTLNSGFETITATQGQIITSWTATDSATGYPTNYTYFFNVADRSIGQNSFVVAGTILSYGCTQISINDEDGTPWTNINSNQFVYADGSGGSYTINNLNTTTCGMLPMGYVSQKNVISESFSYYNYEQTDSFAFVYGATTYKSVEDGSGGNTLETSGEYYYNAGYIFYSYHDDAGQRTVNYAFDGVSGYVVQYVMD